MLHDFYTKLSNQEKLFLYITLGVISVAVFDFLFLQPVMSKLHVLDVQIVQTKDDIKRDVRYLAYKDKVLKEDEVYRVFQPDEQKTEEQIFSAFLKTVENFASEVDVTAGKINPGEVVHKKGYAQYFANMECSGKFENIVKLIHKIDTTTNLLKVVKLNIAGKKSSADEVTVVMRISKLILDVKSDEDKSTAEKPTDESASGLAGSLGSAAESGGSASSGNNVKSAKAAGGSGGASSASGGKSGQQGNAAKGNGEAGQGGGGSGSGGGEAGNAVGGSGSGGGEAGNTVGGSGSGTGENAGGGNGGSPANGAGANSGQTSGGGQNTGGLGFVGSQSTAANSSAKNSVSGGQSSAAGGDQKIIGGQASGGGGAAGAAGLNSKSVGNSARSASSSYGAGDGNTDGEDSAAGASGAGGSSKSAKAKTDNREKPKADDMAKAKKKSDTPLNQVATGERVQVKSLESLWNDFWGIKPKAVEEKSPVKTQEKKFNPDEYKTEDELKPNVFERMLDKKE